MTQRVSLPPSEGQSRFAISLGLLFLRLVLGWTFIYHGSQKLFGAFDGMGMSGPTGWVAIMGNLGMPVLPAAAWAYISACGEFFGGLFVFAGLLTRLAALPIIASMCVAIIKVHGPIGFSAGPPSLPGYEFNLNLIAMAVMLVMAGGGLISIDAMIFKRGLWSRGPQPLSMPGQRTM